MMEELYDRAIADLENITQAWVVASTKIGSLRIFEVRLEDKNRNYKGSINIQLETLKQLGIAKTLNSFKKVQTWLDHKEGLAYVVNAQKQKYERGKQRHNKRRQ